MEGGVFFGWFWRFGVVDDVVDDAEGGRRVGSWVFEGCLSAFGDCFRRLWEPVGRAICVEHYEWKVGSNRGDKGPIS